VTENMPKAHKKPIFMVSSAVYGFEELLGCIYATLAKPRLVTNASFRTITPIVVNPGPRAKAGGISWD
jgi:hypothetical protein